MSKEYSDVGPTTKAIMILLGVVVWAFVIMTYVSHQVSNYDYSNAYPTVTTNDGIEVTMRDGEAIEVETDGSEPRYFRFYVSKDKAEQLIMLYRKTAGKITSEEYFSIALDRGLMRIDKTTGEPQE